MDLCISAGDATSHDQYSRVLRWKYRRGRETLLCELGLTRDDSAYELRLAPRNPVGSTAELFNDALAAFQRLSSIERRLLTEGWSLESFESDRIARS